MSSKHGKLGRLGKVNVRACETFGEVLRIAQAKHGVSMESMAKATGIPLETIREYARDFRLISVDNARKFSTVLNVDPSDLEWRASEDGKLNRGDYH